MNVYKYHANPEDLDSHSYLIRKHPKFAYQHAHSLGKRFPDGEAAIARDAGYAYMYAISIIKGRWPEGEAAIATDPYTSYTYAANIIKGRWPQGEAAIAKSAHASFLYSTKVLLYRFIPGEFEISDSRYKYKYEEFFGIEL